MRKFLIDTDAGIDDSVAVMMAFAQPDIEIVAVTSVFGTSTLEHTTRNVRDVCGLIGLNTRIGVGAEKAIIKPKREAQPGGFHGMNGVGDVVLPSSGLVPDGRKAWDVMCEEAYRQGGNLEIVTLGPLTNLAIALLKYPVLASLVKRLVIMGGSAKTGNVSAHAEANLFGDPLAGEIVFRSGIKEIILVGLNATEQCRLTTAETNHLFSKKTVVHPYIDKMLETYKNSQNKNGEAGMLINDGVAMAVAIDPSIAEILPCHVTCEMMPTHNEGRTVADFRPFSEHKKNVGVTMAISRKQYVEILSGTIDFLAEKAH